MRFAKGHGTGNDFVILPDGEDVSAGTVAWLCDRRFGIGGDGVLRVARDDDGPWFMDYRNADGSLAEMCGNGVRVYARYLVDSGRAEPGPIAIRTRSGPVTAVVPETGDIRVDMGLPKLLGESSATLSGVAYPGTAVAVGNPHLVCPVPELSTLDLSAPPTFDDAFFPEGVNVEFMVPEADDHVRMRVYERGSGETLSCGSGAVAVALVAMGERATGTMTVDVPGGRLSVTFDGSTCWLAGPAVIVASGETRGGVDAG